MAHRSAAPKRIFAFIALFSLFFTTFFLSKLPEEANAADPGAPVEIVDSAGNQFSFRITTLRDGTGHGTTSQCFINSATGYAIGDNTPTDGYVCNRDTTLYRVDWNATIVNTTNAKVTFNAGNNIQNDLPFSEYGNIGSSWGDTGFLGVFDWNSGGLSGGSTLGFTGSGNNNYPDAQMTFSQTGQSSGYWTFSYTNGSYGWNEVIGKLQMTLDAKFTNGSSQKGITDRAVTYISESRMDLKAFSPRLGSVGETYNNTAYRNVEIHNNSNSFTIFYPNYASGKGYWHNPWNGSEAGMVEPFMVRHKLLNAPANTMYYLDGNWLTPQWDGNDAYFDVKVNQKPSWKIPWDAVPLGVSSMTARMDPLDPIIKNKLNEENLNGAIEPGANLACGVTTQNAVPGALEGDTDANNNCYKITFDKRYGNGNFWKKTSWGGVGLEDGSIDYRGFLATGTASTQVLVGAGPVGTKDLAMCDVWDVKEMGFSYLGMSPWDESKMIDAYPSAKIYYTTKDLRPTVQGEAPNCGTPSDTTKWSLTPPSDLMQVSGVMVVFPGNDSIYGDISFYVKNKLKASYPSLVTTPVIDYMGYTTNSTVNNPTWGVDDDYINIYNSYSNPRVEWSGATIPIGKVTTKTSLSGYSLKIAGAQVPGALYTMRLYLDNCATNTKLTSTAMYPGTYTDINLVEGVQDPTKCGQASTSYWEVTVDPNKAEGGWGDGMMLTWDTPITSAPGDTYRFETKWYEKAEGDNYLFRPTPTSITFTVGDSAAVGSAKAVDDPLVSINTPFSNTIGWFNYSDAPAGKTQFIDVLPYKGDANGSNYSGALNLSAVTFINGGTPQQSTIEYTKIPSETLSDQASHSSNQAGGSTVWCTSLSGGACPTTLAEVTGLRFTMDSFDKKTSQFYKLTFSPTGNKNEEKYVNRLGEGSTTLLGRPIPAAPPVTTVVYSNHVSGTVYEDFNTDYKKDDGEAPVKNYTVKLLDKDNNVIATTTTDAAGHYEFTELPDGDYKVEVTAANTPWKLNLQADSLKDTNRSQIFTLKNTDRENVDFGLVKAPAIALTKDVDKATAYVGNTLTYTIKATNSGGVDLTPAFTDNQCEGFKVTGGDNNGDGLINVGEIWTATCSHTVSQADLVAGYYTNTAKVVGTPTTPLLETVESEDTASTDIYSSAVKIEVCSKTSDCASPVVGINIDWHDSPQVTGDDGSYTYGNLKPNEDGTLSVTVPAWAYVKEVLVDGVSVGTTIPASVTSPANGTKTVTVVIDFESTNGGTDNPKPPVFESGLSSHSFIEGVETGFRNTTTVTALLVNLLKIMNKPSALAYTTIRLALTV